MQAVGLLIRRIRAVAQSNELSLAEAAVLRRLDKDGRATTADLARAESLKPQSMGATVAALEKEGLVERKPHPTDGRQVYIQLTKKGADVREQRRAAKHMWLADQIGRLSRREQEVVFEAAEILRRLGEK